MSASWTAPGELNIYAAAESGAAIAALLADLEAGDELRLDLTHVSEIDAAGLQLLLATLLAGKRDGRMITFAGIPHVVRERFEWLDLGGYLGAGESAGEPA
jgi:anti-anti-sigma regulatory factor